MRTRPPLEKIEAIYQAALDQEPEHLSAFLASACEGDEVLRRKIESLLASRKHAERFIETSAVGLAAKIIQHEQADSLVGETIGHYRISEPIGTGGMGDVYLATDIVAGRKAALKLLPLRFTGDAQRLKRFEQEAHAVVALNHPNILTIYEIGEDHSIHYIASELIEGETLRDRLARGPMQLIEAVDVAIQVANALAAAHLAGIVHRDIKPENVMLRPDGYVKVLDFGIAKLAEEASGADNGVCEGSGAAGTLPAPLQGVSELLRTGLSASRIETNLGSVLGTVRYMSPEQARGGHVDKTTDIWSLGVVLYEMISGHAPFSGDTPKEVMSSILEKEPPALTRYIARAPAELQQIVSKMLRKDRAQRYRSAQELLNALKDLRRKLEFESFSGSGFFDEVKRRKVYRVAAAYIIVAAGIIQLASAALPAWELPNWALRLVIVLLLVGFPLALILGWVFDLTSQGIRVTPGTPRGRNMLMLVAAGVIISAVAGFLLIPRVSAYKVDKSIAVLPFENLIRDPDNAYLAEGIQDEILTRLSKIADLKVISRTSTQQYKSAQKNLPEIAKQLGVAHILEGSVQKSGDSVRVNVQLIKAATDSHVWADTFDRKLTDILSVESEVAKAVADQLQAKLTGHEEQLIAAKPTDNPEAYDAYLRGLAYALKGADTLTTAYGAQKYLREAVRLDPKFALAWALLSYTDAIGYVTRALQPTDALREEARKAAETALTLQPDLGEALMAMGHYYYACLKDYDIATRYLEQARQRLRNDSRIPELLAYITRRRGQWDRSEAYFKEAEELSARDASLLRQHALSYIYLRRFPEALRKLDQVLNITPDDVGILALQAAIAQAEGDLPRAAALLTQSRSTADDFNAFELRIYQAILERKPAQIIPLIKEELAKADPALGFRTGELRFKLGWAQELAGDHAAAQESWRLARSELDSFLKEQPENWQLINLLAEVNMGLGDKAAAFGLLERAMAAMPIEKDALDGPVVIETFAEVAARMGEPDRAIAALRKVISLPSRSLTPLTPALLRLDPRWDPLRGDPRFQELCEDRQP